MARTDAAPETAALRGTEAWVRAKVVEEMRDAFKAISAAPLLAEQNVNLTLVGTQAERASDAVMVRSRG